MLKLPNLEGKESNTLYIIGNGFDLYHNIKSSYNDFHDWLIRYNYSDFVDYMEKMFPTLKDGKLLLWQDFETALGKGDPKEIHKSFFQGTDNGFFNVNVQNRVIERIKPMLNKIPQLLKEWAESLPVEEIKRKPELSAICNKSLYLSFNYTMVLEKVYSVFPDRVIHIHNCLADEKTPFITGHNVLYTDSDAYDLNDNIEESSKKIIKELNALNKPVDKIIREHKAFFESLDHISNVIVFGFSISKIDRLYFTEIFHHVLDGTRWFFVCKDEGAKRFFEKIVNQYNDNLKKRIGGGQYLRKMATQNCQYIIVNE